MQTGRWHDNHRWRRPGKSAHSGWLAAPDQSLRAGAIGIGSRPCAGSAGATVRLEAVAMRAPSAYGSNLLAPSLYGLRGSCTERAPSVYGSRGSLTERALSVNGSRAPGAAGPAACEPAAAASRAVARRKRLARLVDKIDFLNGGLLEVGQQVPAGRRVLRTVSPQSVAWTTLDNSQPADKLSRRSRGAPLNDGIGYTLVQWRALPLPPIFDTSKAAFRRRANGCEASKPSQASAHWLNWRKSRPENLSVCAMPVARFMHRPPGQLPNVSAQLAEVLVLSAHLQHVSRFLAGQAMRDAAVTVPQWLVLRHLRDTGGCTLTSLAAALDHDRGALSRTLYRLRQRQLITPRTQGGDRRTVRLVLAPAGMALCNAVEEAMRRQLEGDFEQVGVQPQDTLRRLTSAMHHAAATLGSVAAVSSNRIPIFHQCNRQSAAPRWILPCQALSGSNQYRYLRPMERRPPLALT